MCRVSSKEDETMKIIFTQGFNRDETEEITEAFSKIVPVKEYHFATDSIEPVTTVVIIFMLGFITRDIVQGFFYCMTYFQKHFTLWVKTLRREIGAKVWLKTKKSNIMFLNFI